MSGPGAAGEAGEQAVLDGRRGLLRWSKLALGLLCALPIGGGGVARADDAAPRVVTFLPGDGRAPQQRHFGFLADGTTPSAGVASLGYAFGAGSGISADRPIPVDLAAGSGGSHSLSFGYGLTDRLAPFAGATFSSSALDPGATSTVAQLGAAWQLTRPGTPLHAALSGALAYESVGQTPGFTAVAAVGLDRGRYQLVLASGLGLNDRSPRARVRAGFTVSY